MKRVLFLAVIATAFSFSAFSQKSQKEVTINPGEQAIVKTTPCPVAVTNIDVPTQPVWKTLTPPKRDRVVYVKDKPSVNNTNSNNVTITINANQHHYPAPTPKEGAANWWYGNDSGGWLAGLLIFLIVGGLIAALIYSLNHKGSAGNSPVTVHVPPAPPASKPTVVVPPSETEISAALEKAEKTGGTFWREPNGGYRVDFPKPKEEKPAEEKKD